MPLSLNEIRAATEHLVTKWQDILLTEKVSEDSHTQKFYIDLFEALGLGKERAIKYEARAKGEAKGDNTKFIDIFWPGKLLVEQKSPHKDLDKAEKQALDYIPLLKHRRDWPAYVLVSDFRIFRLLKLHNGEQGKLYPEVVERWNFSLGELPNKLDLLGFMTGYQRVSFRDQPPVNRKAAELMASLHDELAATGFDGHQLEIFLVRLLFCLFADDTGLFNQPDLMKDYLEAETRPDGKDTGHTLGLFFQVLDTPLDKRSNALHPLLLQLPYVNGGLFKERLDMPTFTKMAHEELLDACAFNWREVSPAVFGNLFQTVTRLSKAQRQRELGAHYTAESNILKVINGLFMDELRAEFTKIKTNKPKLREFHQRLGEIKVLDPACGCGNFLLLAYRELRELELEVIKAENTGADGSVQLVGDISTLSRLNVDQFYGFEIEEFPARIAEVAMYLVDHQMNQRLSALFGKYFARLPLTKVAHITLGNALTLDWAKEVPVNKLSYILGNPPFVGSKMMTKGQRVEILEVFPKLKGNGILDYVTGWYGKAADLMKLNPNIRTAFVSTNSICQGEQVSVLWGHLISKGFHIQFAHRTFAWTSEARGKAAVYCIIVGFGLNRPPQPLLYEYTEIKGHPHVLKVKNISPYLAEGPEIVVTSLNKPLCEVPEMKIGNKPVDGGNYLLSASEKIELVKNEPFAKNYLHPWLGGEEFINDQERWCLYLGDASPSDLRKLPLCLKRVEAVKNFRLKSNSLPTQKIADTPRRFHVENIPKGNFLIVPKTSSEKRAYIPIGFVKYPVMAGDALQLIDKASVYQFGILTSTMHMAWVRYVGGKLEGRYRYSNQLCYNTYPWPSIKKAQEEKITELAQKVLDARSQHPQSTLADLYDTLTMPTDLSKAHNDLDKAVDSVYRKEPFTNERQRVEFLLDRYLLLSSPLTASPKKRKKSV